MSSREVRIILDSSDNRERSYEEWDSLLGSIQRDMAAADIDLFAWDEYDEGVSATMPAADVPAIQQIVAGRCAVIVQPT